LVDHLGLVIEVAISAANCNDRDGLRVMMSKLHLNNKQHPSLIYLDAGYISEELEEEMKEFDCRIEVIKRSDKSFKALPKRWIVERTFAWLGKFRRLSKDFEQYATTSENMIYLAMTRLMLKQIVKLI
jgi:putative transposase